MYSLTSRDLRLLATTISSSSSSMALISPVSARSSALSRSASTFFRYFFSFYFDVFSSTCCSFFCTSSYLLSASSAWFLMPVHQKVSFSKYFLGLKGDQEVKMSVCNTQSFNIFSTFFLSAISQLSFRNVEYFVFLSFLRPFSSSSSLDILSSSWAALLVSTL